MSIPGLLLPVCDYLYILYSDGDERLGFSDPQFQKVE